MKKNFMFASARRRTVLFLRWELYEVCGDVLTGGSTKNQDLVSYLQKRTGKVLQKRAMKRAFHISSAAQESEMNM